MKDTTTLKMIWGAFSDHTLTAREIKGLRYEGKILINLNESETKEERKQRLLAFLEKALDTYLERLEK